MYLHTTNVMEILEWPMNRCLVIFFILLFSLSAATAQPQMDDVVNVLNGGTLENVGRYFDNVVDITIDNNQSTYSQSQAKMVIKNFFNKNSVKSFQIKYKGNATDEESFYLIGELKTFSHGTYRIYFYFRQKGKEPFLQELKIEQ